MNFLPLRKSFEPAKVAISPLREMGAYEALWLEPRATFKSIADRFAADPDALPSDFVAPESASQCAAQALQMLHKNGIASFGIRVHHAGDYSTRLRDAKYPVELLYYRGDWALTESRSVAIVGTRNPDNDGLARARRLAKEAVGNEFTVVSGLAAGIDTAAHLSALSEPRGLTVAVLGTPIGIVYPAQNRELQDRIASDYLLISQVPIIRYSKQGPKQNRLFFPERNVTMSALTEATIIVQASDTSGTLIQARAALHQGRKLFVLESCFNQPGITWPARFEKLGAIRVKTSNDIWAHL